MKKDGGKLEYVMKKDGGKLINWQIHHLKLDSRALKKLKKIRPRALLDPGPMMVTGTLVDEPTGRWKPGAHFRSSLVVEIDRKKGILETENTIYHIDPKTENKDVIPDMGNGVLKMFY